MMHQTATAFMRALKSTACEIRINVFSTDQISEIDRYWVKRSKIVEGSTSLNEASERVALDVPCEFCYRSNEQIEPVQPRPSM
jgi:hypothetical protein